DSYVPIADSGLYGVTVFSPSPFLTTHTVVGPVPFGLIAHGNNVEYSYSYPGGLSLSPSAPPIINFTSPTSDTALLAASTQLLTGFVRAGSASVVSVTVNGRPVDVLDDAGNFFTNVSIVPGVNNFTAVAVDFDDQTATALLSLKGVQPGPINFDQVADV